MTCVVLVDEQQFDWRDHYWYQELVRIVWSVNGKMYTKTVFFTCPLSHHLIRFTAHASSRSMSANRRRP